MNTDCPHRSFFTPLSDEEVDEVVKDVKRDFVQSGYRMVVGVLRSRGLKIQERRVKSQACRHGGCPHEVVTTEAY